RIMRCNLEYGDTVSYEKSPRRMMSEILAPLWSPRSRSTALRKRSAVITDLLKSDFFVCIDLLSPCARDQAAGDRQRPARRVEMDARSSSRDWKKLRISARSGRHVR